MSIDMGSVPNIKLRLKLLRVDLYIFLFLVANS